MGNFQKIVLFGMLSDTLFAEQLTEDIRLDAYSNMITTSNHKDDQFKINGGLQTRYQISDNLSSTAQVFIYEGKNNNEEISNSLEDYDTDLKWLYLDYYLGYDFNIRVGAFQFPVFKSSETGTIGYTYTWTETPLDNYGAFGCDDFEGLELLKRFNYNDLDILTQLSIGESKNELDVHNDETMKGDVKSLLALTLKANNDLMMLNIGYLQARSILENSHDTPSNDESDVKIKMYALESEIYMNNFTLKSGIIYSTLTNVFPDELRYYSSLEYEYASFTPYFLYSNEILDFTNIAQGVGQNNSDQKNITTKYAIGSRYDYTENIAFKLSYTYSVDSMQLSDHKENLYADTVVGTINVIF